jgi:molybdopterin molybdotransferase
MPEFLKLLTPPEALARFLDALPDLPGGKPAEEVETAAALGRITAAAVRAPHPLPSFPRSTVDGFAVRAADTYGASESLPAFLKVTGEVPMGAAPVFSLERGSCAVIHTGGMLPEGADAVVMIEQTQMVSEGEVEIFRAAAVAEDVLKVGEDVAEGEDVIPPGTRLRAAEIGGLMALGLVRILVAARPRVGILSSGDEVVPPEADLQPGQVRDINAYTLGALVEENGGIPVRYGIVGDRVEELYTAASQALEACDMLVVTAGSSASARDLTAEVINRLGKPGVLVHGVNVRPGKPTILAVCNGKPVVGLPGNPVSAVVIAGLFVRPVLERLQGTQASLRPRVPARLTLNLPSQAGREDWVAVRLDQEAAGYRAEPIFGKSNLIFTLAKADGLIRIPADATGLSAGQAVEVWLM